MSKKLLEGVKVVELATFIAAAGAGRFMADCGADVIKIESAKGDPLRHTDPPREDLWICMRIQPGIWRTEIRDVFL